MKRIICFFFIILLCTGCQETKEIVTTKVVSNDQSGIVTIQQEAPVVAETVENEVTSNPVNANGQVIVIDAGHQRYGNSDREPIGPGASETKAKVTTGATGVSTGALESNINLEVAFKLQDKLTAAGYTVIMVRTSQDVNLSNAQRAEIANENNAAAFIRLHCNSADSSSATGTLTMAPSASNPYCSEIADASQSLSKSVVNNICQQTGSKNRGVTITDAMSGINWCQVPVTIVEMGFLSNVDEEQKLIDSSYQDKIAEGIMLGINEFLN